jgi:hypothetical protein
MCEVRVEAEETADHRAYDKTDSVLCVRYDEAEETVENRA